MKKIAKKPVVQPLSNSMTFMASEKLANKIKRVMKQSKIKSISETIRFIIEAY